MINVDLGTVELSSGVGVAIIVVLLVGLRVIWSTKAHRRGEPQRRSKSSDIDNESTPLTIRRGNLCRIIFDSEKERPSTR